MPVVTAAFEKIIIKNIGNAYKQAYKLLGHRVDWKFP